MKDDRTGFPQRAERMRVEWTGSMVDKSVWEARQPQDLVRGVPDIQTVPVARPLPPNQFVGPTATTLEANAAIGATVLTVQSGRGFNAGTKVGVMLDSGSLFNTTTVGDPTSTTITLAHGLPYTAADGNLVYNYTTHIPDPPLP